MREPSRESLPTPRSSGKIFDVADLTLFSSKPYDRAGFDGANGTADAALEINYFDIRLTEHTASLATGSSAVCAFVNDDLSEPVLRALADSGVRIVALCALGSTTSTKSSSASETR